MACEVVVLPHAAHVDRKANGYHVKELARPGANSLSVPAAYDVNAGTAAGSCPITNLSHKRE